MVALVPNPDPVQVTPIAAEVPLTKADPLVEDVVEEKNTRSTEIIAPLEKLRI